MQCENIARTANNPISPYVFVVGCPRSGTTLLQRMLDNHPQLTIANDTHFICRPVKDILRRDPDPAMSPKLLDGVLKYRSTHRMGLKDSDIKQAASDSDTYAEFISKMYTLRGSMQRKNFSGEKTPDYCRQIPTLHALFPRSRYIHIVRDGRETALSTLSWATQNKGPRKWGLWQEDPLGTCALWWRWQVGIGSRDGGALPNYLYHQLRYEDLVTNPRQQLGKISRFLQLPYSEDMVNYHAGKTRHQSGLSAKSAWLPPVQGLRNWREDMSPEDAGVFEGIAGDILTRYGYECLEQQPDAAVSRRVSRCLRWWDQEGIERR